MARGGNDTIERLYEAAIELIGEHGYTGTTVDEIVAHAGVAKGTFYYHFDSKLELVTAVIDDGLQRLAASFKHEAEGAQGSEETLRALVRAELSYIQRYRAFSSFVMGEMWRVDRDWQNGVRVLREEYVSVYAACLRDGVRDGSFRPDLDIETAASAVFGMVATVALSWLVFSPGKAFEEVEPGLYALALGAVRT